MGSVKGVLVAGGSGSRLLPFTRFTHKTLLPIFDRPVIDYALKTMRESGITEITIIANEHIGQIAKHLGGGESDEKIHFVIEEQPRGVENALALARPYVEGSRMMLYFSDNITTWDFSDDVRDFENSEEPPGAILLAREVDDPSSFGVCVIGEGGEVVDVVEKPEEPPSDLAIGGIYLFDETFFERVDSVEEGFSISDVTRKYVSEGKAAIRNIGNTTWIDCGTPLSLHEASELAIKGEIQPKF